MPTRLSLGGIPIQIDLSNREFTAYRQDMIAIIPTLTPEWTDFHPSDPGMVTIELFSAIADNLGFYQDRCANENFLATASYRASALKFARFATYTPRANVSAVVPIQVTTSGAGLIAKDFSISSVPTQSQEAVPFLLRADFSAPGASTYSLEFIEGEAYSDVLGSSSGLADQTFIVQRFPIAHNPDGTSSLVLSVDETGTPEVWDRVDNFRTSAATDKHYIERVNQFDQTFVQFGDGVNGKIPAVGVSNLTVEGRIGGGVIGNQIGIDKITRITSSAPGVVTSVTNAESPQGGEDRESLEEMKKNIPIHIRANDRAVTDDDYAFHATQVSGVASAKAVRGPSAYQMNIYCRVGGEDPRPNGAWDSVTETGTGLIGQVGNYLLPKREGPVRMNITGPEIIRPFIDATIHIKSSFRQSDVQTSVERAMSAILNGYEIDDDGLDLGNIDDIPEAAPLPDGFPRNMGNTLRRSYLQQMLESISGVDYIDLDRLQRNPFARKEFGFNADTSFSAIEVGQTTQEETWIMEFTSATTFTLNGSVSGFQTATGTLGSLYTSDNSEISFTATAVSIDESAGNRYEIVTGVYLDSIEIQELELLTNYSPSGDVHGASINLTFIGGIT